MSQTNRILAGALLGLALILGLSSLFVVEQTEQAIILRLGEFRRTVDEPGLHAKIPFLDTVVRYDRRLLDLDPPAEPVLLADQKRIEVDTYTRFRISDPLRFYQSMRTEELARARLRDLVNGSLRRVLGTVMLPSVLSDERDKIMADIQKQVSHEVEAFGIAIADVRIRRADLPEETSQAIYDRMKSERERQAKEARAQGHERALQIRARADRERTVILAEAQRSAQILRGEGDSEANKVYNAAFTKDVEFFALYRSLQAYRAALSDTNTTLVLSPDSEFFRYFSKPNLGRR